MHFRVLGRSIVVLGSPSAISEVLEKRSLTTSGRLQSPLIELQVIAALRLSMANVNDLAQVRI